MFVIDMNTSLINYFISCLLGALIMGFALYKYKKTFDGLNCFFIYYLIASLGLLFIILRPSLPILIGVLIANIFLIISKQILLCGMLNFYKIKIQYKYFIIFNIIFVFGLSFYTYGVPSVPMRIIIFSVFSLFIHLVAFINLHIKLKTLNRKTSAFQNINIYYIFYYIVRVSALLISKENSASFFDYNIDAFILLIDSALALIVLVAIFTDFRDRINEELIISSKQADFFANLYKISPVPIIVLSEKLSILHANNALCELVDLPEEHLIGRAWKDAFLCYETGNEISDFAKSITPDAKCQKYAIKIYGKDAKKIPVELVMEGHFDEFGYVSYYLSYLHDLTYINEQKDKMIEAERSRANLLANIPGFAYRCKFDRNWTMERISESFNELTGYMPEEIIGNAVLSFNDIIVEDFREIVWTDWNTSIENGKPYTGEYKIRKKSGEEIWVWERGRAILNYNGKIVALEGFISNINERKLLEEKNAIMEMRLRNQQKLEAIGTLAGGVAHEINNPINGIMNYGQLLIEINESDKEAVTYAKEIVRESERIAGIVKNLLQFSSQRDDEFYNAEICEIVRNSLSLINTILKQDKIELKLKIPNELPQIMCREFQIQQVIMNLITNSRDALNEKYKEDSMNKVMKLSCQKISIDGYDWIRIKVEDNGNGIPIGIQDKIFEPFFTTKGRSIGTGLGLAISYRIIEEHKGSLTFESVEGEYTKFYIDLPVFSEN